MADEEVDFLLGNLKQVLIDNPKLMSNIKDQVESLCEELRLLAAFVDETTGRRTEDAVFQELVRQIRVEVYEAEDIVDTYLSNSSLQKFRHLVDYSKQLRMVRKEIKNIWQRVEYINDCELLGAGGVRMKPPCVEETNVVGFDKDIEQVVSRLMVENQHPKVISIVGMGGLGKTTLAKKVYNHPSIQKEFTIRSWVFVSQVYDRRKVLCKVLYDVTGKNWDTSECSDDDLAYELYSKLKNGRYLIVLDGVWNANVWRDLGTMFPYTMNRSRLLLTTRILTVALFPSRPLDPYRLRFLTDDESWELLENKVSLKGTRCPKELEAVGKQIARKCYGLPLAIVVIAGILQKQDKTIYSWERIEKKVNTYMAMESEICMDVLALSYTSLSRNMKSLFLYLGVFPQNYAIPARKLINIWAAEGFVKQLVDDDDMEATVDRYLEDLVDRNLVLVETRRADGGIKTCRIHSTMREFCIKQAEEEDFFKETRGLCSLAVPNVVRCLCVHSQVSNYLSQKIDCSHVRAFFCYSKEETRLSPDLKSYFPGSFKLLRVLDAQPISFPHFPNILKLIHLRYLALFGTFEVLPAAISTLRNLQTLVVETNSRNIDVQVDLGKLLQLRHIYTSAPSDFPTPSSESRKKRRDPRVNKNLRTMSLVSPDSCTDVILARTPNLQKLGVHGKLLLLLEENGGACKFANVAKLFDLENLKLLNSEGRLHSLPEASMFPPNLRKLTLFNTLLGWEAMLVLGMLPNLEILKLGDYAFVGEHWETPDLIFSKLRVFQIGKTDLVHWKASVRQFPHLKRLILKHCEHLVAVPGCLGDIITLVAVELYSTPPSVATSARQIQKNFELLVFPPDQETQGSVVTPLEALP